MIKKIPFVLKAAFWGILGYAVPYKITEYCGFTPLARYLFYMDTLMNFSIWFTVVKRYESRIRDYNDKYEED